MSSSAGGGGASRGGCHCGRVAFRVHRAPPESVLECNCSICSMKAYLHWFVPRSAFELLTPWDDLATYQFNTKAARHHFCPTCGVAPFYVARSHPDSIDVNVRCVDGIDLAALTIEPFDGQNWEQAYSKLGPGS